MNNPFGSVTLFKLSEDKSWKPFPTDGLFNYHPELGFIFDQKLASGKLLPGTYNCSSNGDLMTVTLKDGEKPPPPIIDQSITPPANFTVMVSRNSFSVKCCSSSPTTAPLLKISRCDNKFFCKNQQQYTTSLVSPSKVVTCRY